MSADLILWTFAAISLAALWTEYVLFLSVALVTGLKDPRLREAASDKFWLGRIEQDYVTLGYAAIIVSAAACLSLLPGLQLGRVLFGLAVVTWLGLACVLRVGALLYVRRLYIGFSPNEDGCAKRC